MRESIGTTRRQFLGLGVVATGALLVGANGFLAPRTALAGELKRWSDPATWGGAVPAPGSFVRVTQDVLLDVDARVQGLVVEAGAALHFDARASRTLVSSRNVVVKGSLLMRPESAAVEHILRFVDVDEEAFVGGGMAPLATDVGLWCIDAGVLDVAGTPRLAWARSSGSIAAGVATVQLQADPVGWRPGDQLTITPSGRSSSGAHFDAYDSVTVLRVEGRLVTLTSPTRFAHPVVDVGDGVLVAPEVLNLTRNVSIEGTAGHRTHVWLLPDQPHFLSYFALRHVGPRKRNADGFTDPVLGRYGLHLHMAGDASRGSQVVGAVVRDCGNHAIVTHGSHGVSYTSCITHDTFEDAYWYDAVNQDGTAAVDTNDLLYDSCVASRIRCDPPFNGYRLTGFSLGHGQGHVIRDSVTTGVQGNVDSSGFGWPEAPKTGVWDFQRCVAHNNKRHGIFTWQNTPLLHIVRDFICSDNGGSGISHGAYVNSYEYVNGYLFRNAESSIDLHSHSAAQDDPPPQTFRNLRCDGAGLSDHAVRLLRHTPFPTGPPSVFRGCTFVGQRKEAVIAYYAHNNGATTPEKVDLVDCRSSTPLLWFRNDTLAASVVRVQDSASAVLARPKANGGTVRADWNAVVETIPAFTSSSGGGGARPVPVVVAAVRPVVAVVPAPTSTAPTPAPTAVPITAPSPSASPTHAHPKRPQLRIRVRRLRQAVVLTVANDDTAPCDVEIRIDGRPVSTIIRLTTARRIRLERPAGARTLTVHCHGSVVSEHVLTGRRAISPSRTQLR